MDRRTGAIRKGRGRCRRLTNRPPGGADRRRGGQACGGKLHIVTSYNPKTISQAGLPEEFRYLSTVHPADALLDDLSRIVTDRGLEPVLHSSYGGPVESIVRIAEEIDADLIVVGNKGMKGARRVLGSIPNSVAHTAPCSVLIADTVAAVGESD